MDRSEQAHESALLYIEAMRIALLLMGFAVALGWSLNKSSITSSFSTGMTADGIAPRDEYVMSPLMMEGVVDSNYTIGPGDYFEIIAENSSVTIQVSPEGLISMEQVGVVDVGGVSLTEAKKRILAMVVKRYSASECFVKLAQMKKFRVGIYGALYNSGQQILEPGQRLSLAIRMVGGAGPTANLDSVLLIRHGDTTRVHLSDTELRGDISQDPVLQQGDIIFVPEMGLNVPTVYLRLMGMNKALPWRKGATVFEYIAKCKIAKRDENQYTHIRIEKNGGMNVQQLALPKGYSYQPEPGDVIQPSIVGSEVFVGGATAYLGHMEYDPTYHPQDYISKAGVTPITVGYGKVHVIHRDGTDEMMDPSTGIIVPGDYIDVPKSTYETFKDATMFLATVLGVVGTYLALYITYQANKN